METEVPFRQEAETEEDIKGKTAETEKAGEKTEEQTERETERPVLQIYTGEENEEKEDTGEKENAEEQTLTRQADTVSLLFAGDIYLSEHVLNAYERGGGIEGVLDSGFLQTIEQADIYGKPGISLQQPGNAGDGQAVYVPPSRRKGIDHAGDRAGYCGSGQ